MEKPTRSWPRRILIYLCWTVGALVGVYVVLLTRFITGRPDPKTNYTTQLNAPSEAASESDIAWPIYRKALLGFDFFAADAGNKDGELLDARPQGEKWDDLVKWLGAHEKDLALLREGSRKPLLGFLYGPGGDAADWQVFPNTNTGNQTDPNPPLISILLPHLNLLRTCAQALSADARLARNQGDSPRAIEDVRAILGIAAQLRNQFIISDLVALTMTTLAMNEVESLLFDPAHRTSDNDLSSLAEAIRLPDRAEQVISYDNERRFLDDLTQRMYTDNGNGDGHLTLQGMRFASEFTAPSKTGATPEGRIILQGILAPVFAASRRETVAEYTKHFDIADANLRKPFTETDWSAYDSEFQQKSQSLPWGLKFPWMAQVLPSLLQSRATAEPYLARRDALLIGISLERFHREHGNYPATLEELIPAHMPAIPGDRLTRQPLKYRLIDGLPLIYSVGPDGDDDGGRAKDGAGKPVSVQSFIRLQSGSPAIDGDFILYPQPREP